MKNRVIFIVKIIAVIAILFTISGPGFDMVVCGCSVAGRKYHIGKSAMARRNSMT